MSAPTRKPSFAEQPPPAHRVRSSARARRISLRVLPGKGLEVVLPLHVDPTCVPAVLARHRRWIDKALHRMQAVLPNAWPDTGQNAEENTDEDAGFVLPDMFLLKGGCEQVELCRKEGRNAPAKPASLVPSARPASPTPPARPAPPDPAGRGIVGARLSARRVLALPDGSRKWQAAYLKNWLRQEAKDYLGAMLRALADECRFSYAGFSVRFQRSRWGSCSAAGSINLNACLIFLPERLTRYILLHELCHTRHLNHSPDFWKLVFALDPDALAKDKAMRWAWKHVPPWIFH